MPKRVRKLLFASVAFAVFAVFAVFLITNRSPLLPPLPNPNGYDDILNAGKALKGDVSAVATLDHDGLREWVSTNAEPLRLLRLGLSRRCAVPIGSSLTNLNGMMNDLPGVKRLAHLLAAEGRLAELDNRLGDAALSYADCIHLGNEISRGGFMIHRLVGIALEAIGLGPLATLSTKLNCEQARPIIAELERIDSTRVTWDEVMQAERIFSQHEFHKRPNPILWVTSWWQNRLATRKSEEKDKKIVARVRLLTAELALRCYQLEQGQAPPRLEQLVPKRLQHVPMDPFRRR